jgi:tetratricopeptide (TPR) repeat protein
VNSSNFDKAVELYQAHSPQSLPDPAESFLIEASAYMGKHDYGAAAGALDEALKHRLPAAKSYYAHGLAYLFRGDPTDAIAVFEKWSKNDPKDAGPQKALGLAHFEAKDYAAAVNDFQRAAVLAPNNADPHFGLASVYSTEAQENPQNSAGMHQQAIQEFTKVIEIQPKSGDAYRYRGYQYQALGELDLKKDGQHSQAINELNKAIADYQAAWKLEPECAQVEVGLGTAQSEKGDQDAAIADLEAATKLQPGLTDAHLALGAALMQKNEFAQAIPELVHGGAGSSGNTDGRAVLFQAHVGLAQVLYKRGKVAEAETEFRDAERMNPGAPGPHELLAMLLVNDAKSLATKVPIPEAEVFAKFTDALAEGDLFLKYSTDPTQRAVVQQLVNQVDTALAKEHTALAKEHKDKATSLISGANGLFDKWPLHRPELLMQSNAAVSEAEQFLKYSADPKQKAGALQLLSQAHGLHVAAIFTPSTLGEAHAEQKEAIRELEEALKLDPNLPGANEQMQSLKTLLSAN